MAKAKSVKGLFSLVASRNKNTKKIERLTKIKKPAKGSKLSYPEEIGYGF